MEELDDLDGATQTTLPGLIRLASVMTSMVREGALDTRFAGKLLKRMDREARRMAKGGEAVLDEASQSALFGAIGEFDLALRQRDAASLVEANARLRDTEEATAKRRKSRKDAAD